MMRFLTPSEWQAWCIERRIPLCEVGSIRPDISAEHFHIANVPYPVDSGKKVWLARFLFSLVQPNPETLLLIDEWAVWPSSQHMPLFTRFRQAFGESRPLSESPGHLVSTSDSDDAVSIIATSLLFVWDCYGIDSSGRDIFHISHDEFCLFGSRDKSVTEGVTRQLAARLPLPHRGRGLGWGQAACARKRRRVWNWATPSSRPSPPMGEKESKGRSPAPRSRGEGELQGQGQDAPSFISFILRIDSVSTRRLEEALLASCAPRFDSSQFA